MTFEDAEPMIKGLLALCEKFPSDELVSLYYRQVKTVSAEALAWAIDQTLGNPDLRRAPRPVELRQLAERYRDGRREIPCQHQGCRVRLEWPPAEAIDERAYYCQRHQPELPERRLSLEERQANSQRMTVKGRALLRCVAGHLLEGIAISPEEQAEIDGWNRGPFRVSRAERALSNPFFSPKAYRERLALNASALPAGYEDRRRQVSAAGYQWDQAQGVWKKGRRMLSDWDIDVMSPTVLDDYLKRGRT